MEADFKSHLRDLVDHSEEFLNERFAGLVESGLQTARKCCEQRAQRGFFRINVGDIPIQLPGDIDRDLYWSGVATHLGINYFRKVQHCTGFEGYPYIDIMRFLSWGDPEEEISPEKPSFFRSILRRFRIG